MTKYLTVLFCVIVSVSSAAEKADSTKTEVKTTDIDEKRIIGKIKTIYTAKGRPTQQKRASKGWHQVADAVKLVAGRATVTVNTSTAEGRQDVSFIDKTSYRGLAFSLDTVNTFTYRLVPISGIKFMIISSSPSDTVTVNYLVEGE